MPEWFVVLKEFKNVRCGAFLFVAWWMGFGIGLIFAFLFWHLQVSGSESCGFGINHNLLYFHFSRLTCTCLVINSIATGIAISCHNMTLLCEIQQRCTTTWDLLIGV